MLATGIIEGLLKRRNRSAGVAGALESAGLKFRPAEFVLLVVVGCVLLAGGGLVVGGAFLATVLLLATPLLARSGLRILASRRRKQFADQLDDTLQLLAGGLRAGHSLLRAIDAVSGESEAPTSEEFTRIINETRLGRDLGEALDDAADRTKSEDFSWVAQAIAIHREVGGNLADVLDQVGQTIRERNQIRRQVKALSAEGKISAIVLMVLPFALGGILLVISPGYMDPFVETPVGLVLMGASAVLLTLGGLWLRKVVSFKF
jgi:tight adherence protein B